jgi:hypothetical protein
VNEPLESAADEPAKHDPVSSHDAPNIASNDATNPPVTRTHRHNSAFQRAALIRVWSTHEQPKDREALHTVETPCRGDA